MTDYNKANLKNLCVGGLALLVFFLAVVAGWYVVKAHGGWCLPLPVAGVCYGIYAFVKKYVKPLPRPENKKQNKE